MTTTSKLQIKWRCRRGMLELDLLLIPFFEKKFEFLSSELKSQFIELLDCPDPDIYNWFLGATPSPPEFQPIIERLRDYHHQDFKT